MIIVKNRPMETRFDNIVTFLNELTVSIYLYVIMVLNLFLQGKYPPSYRNICGIILMAVLIGTISANLIAFIIQVFLVLRKKFLRWFYSRKAPV